MSDDKKRRILERLQRECDVINSCEEVWQDILKTKSHDERMELTKWRYRPGYKFHPENCRARRTADSMVDLEEEDTL